MRDSDIFSQISGWLALNQPVWLCTVLSTWGSAPRPAGSLLACTAQGDVIGSLSGGCVEEDLLQRMGAGKFNASVSRVRYGATAEECERLRLPCGGILDIAIELLLVTPENQTVISAIAEALSARQRILFSRDFIAGSRSVSKEVAGEPLLSTTEKPVTETDENVLTGLRQVYGPQYRLLLIGISEVSRAVAQIALLLDYDIIVCDPRKDRQAFWDVPDVTLLTCMPDDAVRTIGDDPGCAILALTHDPRIDDMGLMEAFATRAFYIGAMGSQQTSNKRRERLLHLGVDEQQLLRLHAPIGLDTGSKTPAEIAVSVLAELTAVRAGKRT